MKTRILYPDRIWTDKAFHSLGTAEKLFCLYLLSNRYIELTRIYKCPDLAIMFDLKISEDELQSLKTEIEKTRLFFFFEEWVFVNNDFSYVDYEGRDRVMDAKERETKNIPPFVLSHFEGVTNGLQSGYKPPLNHKSEIINPKPEIINQKSEHVETENVFERVYAVAIERTSSTTKSGISTAWQQKGFMWAEKLGIDLKALDQSKNYTGRWLELFKKSETNTDVSRALNSVFGSLIDSPKFLSLANENRVLYVFGAVNGFLKGGDSK